MSLVTNQEARRVQLSNIKVFKQATEQLNLRCPADVKEVLRKRAEIEGRGMNFLAISILAEELGVEI